MAVPPSQTAGGEGHQREKLHQNGAQNAFAKGGRKANAPRSRGEDIFFA